MKKELIQKLHKSFEERAHQKDGLEYWQARELQELLGYTEWRNFEAVIGKAKIACEKAGQGVGDHFVDVNKMVGIGSQTERPVADLALTRYACYLIAQNGDSRKDAIAFAMTYFALQTRKQEVIEARMVAWERVQAREKLTPSQKELSGVLYERGIDSQGFGREAVDLQLLDVHRRDPFGEMPFPRPLKATSSVVFRRKSRISPILLLFCNR